MINLRNMSQNKVEQKHTNCYTLPSILFYNGVRYGFKTSTVAIFS